MLARSPVILSAPPQNPADECIATVELGTELSVPPGAVCFQCVINGAIVTNATFEIDNQDEGVVVDKLLVIFNTSALFHPSTARILRCFSGMQENQSSVFLDGSTFSCVHQYANCQMLQQVLTIDPFHLQFLLGVDI